MTPVVELKGVTKLFGEKRALSGIDFRVEAGEVEVQVRRGQEKRSLPLEGAGAAAAELWRELP